MSSSRRKFMKSAAASVSLAWGACASWLGRKLGPPRSGLPSRLNRRTPIRGPGAAAFPLRLAVLPAAQSAAGDAARPDPDDCRGVQVQPHPHLAELGLT